jgi:hypothetical protein
MGAGDKEFHVPAVPCGFIRELVLDERCLSMRKGPHLCTICYHSFDLSVVVTEHNVDSLLRSGDERFVGLNRGHFDFRETTPTPSAAPSAVPPAAANCSTDSRRDSGASATTSTRTAATAEPQSNRARLVEKILGSSQLQNEPTLRTKGALEASRCVLHETGEELLDVFARRVDALCPERERYATHLMEFDLSVATAPGIYASRVKVRARAMKALLFEMSQLAEEEHLLPIRMLVLAWAGRWWVRLEELGDDNAELELFYVGLIHADGRTIAERLQEHGSLYNHPASLHAALLTAVNKLHQKHPSGVDPDVQHQTFCVYTMQQLSAASHHNTAEGLLRVVNVAEALVICMLRSHFMRDGGVNVAPGGGCSFTLWDRIGTAIRSSEDGASTLLVDSVAHRDTQLLAVVQVVLNNGRKIETVTLGEVRLVMVATLRTQTQVGISLTRQWSPHDWLLMHLARNKELRERYDSASTFESMALVLNEAMRSSKVARRAAKTPPVIARAAKARAHVEAVLRRIKELYSSRASKLEACRANGQSTQEEAENLLDATLDMDFFDELSAATELINIRAAELETAEALVFSTLNQPRALVELLDPTSRQIPTAATSQHSGSGAGGDGR